MKHLEGCGMPVLYIRRTVTKSQTVVYIVGMYSDY